MKTKVLQAFFIFAFVGGICNPAFAYQSTEAACDTDGGEWVENDDNNPLINAVPLGECTGGTTENTVG